MDRKEIKELAKSKIKGNLWNLLWPMLVIGAVEGIITNIFTPAGTSTLDYTTNTMPQMSPGAALIVALVGIICGIAMIAYNRYVLNFVRDGKMDYHDIINCVKEKWANILVAEILVGILVFLASLLFVIPGIILGLAYSMVTYLVVDTELSSVDAMKKSREMMKGYKWDYFVFGLSFFGWIILLPFTLGILAIWLVPYMTVAQAIYYDRLKAKANVK